MDKRADGQTDMKKVIVTFRNFSNAPEDDCVHHTCCSLTLIKFVRHCTLLRQICQLCRQASGTIPCYFSASPQEHPQLCPTTGDKIITSGSKTRTQWTKAQVHRYIMRFAAAKVFRLVEVFFQGNQIFVKFCLKKTCPKSSCITKGSGGTTFWG